MQEEISFCPHIPNIWPKHGPTGESITFKTPRELVKGLFVEITKQENENAEDITIQASKGWFENFKKGTLCPTQSLWGGLSTSWHHPTLPEAARARAPHGGSVFASEAEACQACIHCTETRVFNVVFSRLPFIWGAIQKGNSGGWKWVSASPPSMICSLDWVPSLVVILPTPASWNPETLHLETLPSLVALFSIALDLELLGFCFHATILLLSHPQARSGLLKQLPVPGPIPSLPPENVSYVLFSFPFSINLYYSVKSKPLCLTQGL